MSSSHHYPLIPKLLFLLAGAFILGGQAGKLHSWQKSQTASASLLSESTSWGLSFQKEGERPVGNATINDLGKYHAYYAEDTNEKKIYLTFDAGYENGNTPRILAYGHFPRPSGPRSPARQGHIKRPVLRLAEPSFLRPANQCC